MHRLFALILVAAICAVAATAAEQPRPLSFGFVALHGGMFDTIKAAGAAQSIVCTYFTDEDLQAGRADFAACDLVFLQHLRGELKPRYAEALRAARARNPAFLALPCSREAEANVRLLLADQLAEGVVAVDPAVQRYYGFNRDNLRRLLGYAAVTYGKRPGAVEPPAEDAPPLVWHPGHEPFPDVAAFLAWIGSTRPDLAQKPRVLVLAHPNHLQFQMPQVVEALIRELERQGLLALCVTDASTPGFEQRQTDFRPEAIIHTCHGSEEPAHRVQLDVPHLSALYTKAVAMDDYLAGIPGLAAGEIQHQITSQELRGTIEPLFAGATRHGGGSEEAVMPDPERIAHIVARTRAQVALRRTAAAAKKVAVVYYDREMGKGELMRGTASGMFMNAPRSLVKLLERLGREGYALTDAPTDEEALLALMKDHGRQVGVWAPGVLDRLARSGKAVLVPEETYRGWFEAKVPEAQRQALIHQWGPPPGDFLVWRDDAGRRFLVIPRIDCGNVILLPQPLRGEAHTASALNGQVHDKLTPPPHHYLATYFWLQEGFRADAMVHFGTHGSEFLLPGKPEGPVRADWGDMIMGAIPNIGLWIINNVGESTPLRRRSYATIVDHLTPPLIETGLADALQNLQGDIEKWQRLEDGALKERFAADITRQVREQRLDQELHLPDTAQRVLSAAEIAATDRHLESLAGETAPVSLHVLGEVPRRELLLPYVVRCAGRAFLDGLGAQMAAGGTAPPEDAVRAKAAEILALLADRGLAPAEALAAAGVRGTAAKPVAEGLTLMRQLWADFQRTGQELDSLVAALNGRFIQPGPANSPDRNPGAVPTGRNLFVVNPEEIPTAPSWELGRQLADNLLADHLKRHGHLPNRVAFSLSPFSSYRDYGVIEAQILWLMGVRPVWSAKRLVTDVELIPAAELKRPRIDVFLSARAYYRDQLPTRMRLIDRAVRLVAALDEAGNQVRDNTARVRGDLVAGGMDPAKAEGLALARMFGTPPGQMGPSWYYYLAGRTGNWDSREDLMKTYLEHTRCAYTEGHWGEDAPEAFNRTIQGTEVVVRSWSDSLASPLSNKYMWWVDGSLALAVKHLTGKEPDYVLADVRDPGRARMVAAADALAADFHVRLFNRRWIEGMKKEGYAGADQMAVHVNNAFGWEVMRAGSVTAAQWQEIADTYVRDAKGMQLRAFFESANPFAFQNLTKTLLESARKGYWQPDDATLREIAVAHAESVARHGEDRGGNAKLRAFVEQVLSSPGAGERSALLASYAERIRETVEVAPAPAPAPVPVAAAPAPTAAAPAGAQPPAAAPAPAAQPVQVSGKRLEQLPPESPFRWLWLVVGCGLLALAGYGFLRRQGSVR